MKKLLYFLVVLAFTNATYAQISTKSVDFTDYKIYSDREYIAPDKSDGSFYLFFQTDKKTFEKGKMTLFQIDSTSKIIQNKELDLSFPRLNSLFLTQSNDSGLNYICRTNKMSPFSKPEGIQLIQNIFFDKKTLSHTVKTLFEINYPLEEIVSVINTDTIHYMITFETKANKINIYSFNFDNLKFKKTYSLPKMNTKKFFEKVLDNASEAKEFANTINTGKFFFKDNIFHLLIDHEGHQYYMPFNLNRDTTSIKELDLALKSSVSLSSNVRRETTGQILDNKLFQLHRLENFLLLGVYDIATFKRLAIIEYKEGDTNTVKNSPFYLDEIAINKKNELKNSSKFYSNLNMRNLAIEVKAKEDNYEIKLGGVYGSRQSNSRNFLMQDMMFQMDMQRWQINNMQRINPPPPIRTGGFRSVSNVLTFLEEEEPREVFFYLKLKKSDFTFANGTVYPNVTELDKLRKSLTVKEQLVTPDFKIEDRKGFGYYDKTKKAFILKIED
jgi:hypothetical protein